MRAGVESEVALTKSPSTISSPVQAAAYFLAYDKRAITDHKKIVSDFIPTID